MQQFQDQRIKMIVATRPTMGQSQELTQADTVIFMDTDWRASTESQAIDRAHRRDDHRNYPGRVLEIIHLIFDVPDSTDDVRAKVRKWKRMLADVFHDFFNPVYIKTFKRIKLRLVDLMEGPQDVYDLDQYELSLVDQMRAESRADSALQRRNSLPAAAG